MTLVKTSQQGIYTANLPIEIPDTLSLILSDLEKSGKKGLIVGGSIRDAIMGESPKDLDIEVYGISYDGLYSLLTPYDYKASPNVVGKSFGVIKIKDIEGNEYDFSIPRRENRTGVGHTGFAVEFDPNITPKEAASRRDFTMNALGYNPLSNEVYDYFGGVNDIDNKILRAVSFAYMEDSLRVLRGMQFAARFDLRMDDKTAEMSRQMMSDYKNLPKERVREEWVKFFTKGEHPARGLEVLVQTGWIELYPELHNMLGGNSREELGNLKLLQKIFSGKWKGLEGYSQIAQDIDWHPEGACVRKIIKKEADNTL